MSLFDNTKNVGTLLIIIGVLDLILGIFGTLFITIDGSNISFGMISSVGLAQIMAIVGYVICAFIEILLGIDITKGACRIQIGNFFSDVGSKYGVLIALVSMCGVTGIISGICTLIGGSAGSALITIIISIIIFVLAYVMADESKGIGKKIIWIILVVVFIIMLLITLFSIIAIVTIPAFLLYLVLVVYIFSPEVKEKMGM